MEKKLLICPFTNEIINPSNQIAGYVRREARNRGLPEEDVKCLMYIATFGDCAKKENFVNLYDNLDYTLPRFKEEFGLPFNVSQFLITYHKCKKRTMSESTVVGAIKSRQTNLERYGVDQTFKVKEFDDKRKKTYLEKYGVDNPFKIKNFHETVEKSYEENYGCSLRERRSVKSIEAWGNKTPKEREKWLEKSVLNAKCKRNSPQSSSQLEYRVAKILIRMGIRFESQFKIKRKFYDFLLPELKIVVEVNGTIYHADPELYKEDDILPITSRVAKEIWAKDKEKLDLAEERGYKMVVIWEKEMHLKNDQELFDLLYEKIENCQHQEART